MEEILHRLISSLSHYLQGFIHVRWGRISSTNSISPGHTSKPWRMKGSSFMTPAMGLSEWINHTRTISLTSAVSLSRCNAATDRTTNDKGSKVLDTQRLKLWNREITVWKSHCCEPTTFQRCEGETHHHDTSQQSRQSHCESGRALS